MNLHPLVYIGNVAAGANTINNLPNGSVCVYSEVGADLMDTSGTGTVVTSTPCAIYNRRSDGNLTISPFFTSTSLANPTYSAFVGSTEQVTLIGSSSSAITGIGTVTVGNTYVVGIRFLNSISDYGTTPIIIPLSYVPTAATNAHLVKGLMESYLNNEQLKRFVTIDRINIDTSFTSMYNSSGADIFLFTKNSATVVGYTLNIEDDDTAVFAAANFSSTTVAANGLVTVPSCLGRTFTFTPNPLTVGAVTNAGAHYIIIGDYLIVAADTDTDSGTGTSEASQTTAIAAAINAAGGPFSAVGTINASTGNDVVTITYNEGFYALPPIVQYSTTGTGSATTVSVTIATGNATPVRYISTTAGSGAATITLDEPWQGETGYVVAGTTPATMFGYIASGNITPTWGLKITGKPQPFNRMTGRYDQILFAVELNSNKFMPWNFEANAVSAINIGFDTDINVYTAQNAFKGNGVWKHVAEMERHMTFVDTDPVLGSYPPKAYFSEADMDIQYDVFNFEIINSSFISTAVGQIPVTKMPVTVFINKDLTTDVENFKLYLDIT